MFISYFIAVVSVFSQVEKLVTGLAGLAHRPLWRVSHQRRRPGPFLLARWPSSSGPCRRLCQTPAKCGHRSPALGAELALISRFPFSPIWQVGADAPQGAGCEPSRQTPACSAPSVLQPADAHVRLRLTKRRLGKTYFREPHQLFPFGALL